MRISSKYTRVYRSQATSHFFMRRPVTNVSSFLCCSKRLFSSTQFEDLVINGARWDDSNYYHRLGFHEEVRDIQRIKDHYRILAKHYHPDNPNAPPDAKAAFQNITEAYEHVSANAKESPGLGNMNEGGFKFSDEARRRAQMRFLGEGVGLFMALTLAFIYIVARHNKARLRARHLWDLLLIFFTIQLFPRLLAAAILYACHTNQLVSLAEFKEQAATTVIMEKQNDGGNISVHVDGIAEDVRENTVLQITTTLASSSSSSESESPTAAAAKTKAKTTTGTKAVAAGRTPSVGKDSSEGLAPSTSTTFTFDSGVTSVSVPAQPGCVSDYRVKVVDMNRGFVLADRTLRL